MTIKHVVRASAVVALSLLSAGCGLINGIPSQTHPSCSWTTQVPSNADSVCNTVFATLRALTEAEFRGDQRTIHRLVPKAAVAARIVDFGRRKRREGLRSLRPTPSLTLGASAHGTLGVGAQVVGQTRGGSFRVPETVYVRVRDGTAYVVDDQPEQEW